MRKMADSTSAASYPGGMDLYAAYISGIYANYAQVEARFPTKRVISIATTSLASATVLDVERWDATPQEAPGWCSRMRSFGIIPTVYCSWAAWPTVKAELDRAGEPYPNWWIAAYPGIGPALFTGSIAHQYANTRTSGGHYDLSVVADYWPGVDPVPSPIPPPSSPHPLEETMPYYCTNSAGTGFVVSLDLSHKTGIVDAADAAVLLATGNYHDLKLSDAELAQIPG